LIDLRYDRAKYVDGYSGTYRGRHVDREMGRYRYMDREMHRHYMDNYVKVIYIER